MYIWNDRITFGISKKKMVDFKSILVFLFCVFLLLLFLDLVKGCLIIFSN